MLSITYVMVRSAEGASRTTPGGRAAPGFRFETNSFTRSPAGTQARRRHGLHPVTKDPRSNRTRLARICSAYPLLRFGPGQRILGRMARTDRPGHANPRNTARARLTAVRVALSTRPITAPIRSRRGVCALSIWICDSRSTPLSGPIPMRSERRVDQMAGDRQDGDRGMLGEQIRLDNHSGPRLAVIAGQGDHDDITSRHSRPLPRKRRPRPPPRPGSRSVSLSRTRRDCRRHSSANPGTRVSGTQIWTGRSPAARNLARRRSTRSALDIGLAILTSQRYM